MRGAIAVLIGLLVPVPGLGQNIPLLRINPDTLALYRQAEPLEQAGNFAGVLEVWRPRLEKGDDLAQFETGMVLLRARAEGPEAARGLDLIRQSAAAGYVRAQLRLYFIYRNGLAPLVQPDPVQAISWLRRSADQGFATSLVHLGLAYESGNGVPRDPQQAFALIQRAAAQNHPFGHFGLGAAYEAGIGVAPDPQRARAAYLQSIERSEWLLSRPNVGYVYKPIYEKWIVDARAAIAGLDSTAARLDAEQAKLAEDRRIVEAENARLAAERKRIADEERSIAAERKAAEEARLVEERRQLEAEQARIAEERRRIEAEAARVAEERRREEQARVAAAKPAPKPAAAPRPAPVAQRQGGENDMAATFGRLVRGLATGIQIAGAVRDTARGVRARDETAVTQGIDKVLSAVGGAASTTGGGTAQGSAAASGGGKAPDPRCAFAKLWIAGGSMQGANWLELRVLNFRRESKQKLQGWLAEYERVHALASAHPPTTDYGRFFRDLAARGIREFRDTVACAEENGEFMVPEGKVVVVLPSYPNAWIRRDKLPSPTEAEKIGYPWAQCETRALRLKELSFFGGRLVFARYNSEDIRSKHLLASQLAYLKDIQAELTGDSALSAALRAMERDPRNSPEGRRALAKIAEYIQALECEARLGFPFSAEEVFVARLPDPLRPLLRFPGTQPPVCVSGSCDPGRL